MLIRLSVSTLANSSGIGKRMPGRNVTGGSITIIERLRRSCRIASREMEPLFLLSSAAAMPVCFAKRCMNFTFPGSSEAMPTLRPTLLEPEEPC